MSWIGARSNILNVERALSQLRFKDNYKGYPRWLDADYCCSEPSLNTTFIASLNCRIKTGPAI